MTTLLKMINSALLLKLAKYVKTYKLVSKFLKNEGGNIPFC